MELFEIISRIIGVIVLNLAYHNETIERMLNWGLTHPTRNCAIQQVWV